MINSAQPCNRLFLLKNSMFNLVLHTRNVIYRPCMWHCGTGGNETVVMSEVSVPVDGYVQASWRRFTCGKRDRAIGLPSSDGMTIEKHARVRQATNRSWFEPVLLTGRQPNNRNTNVSRSMINQSVVEKY